MAVRTDILLSPHTAGSTEEALERTAVETASQVVDVLEGRKPEILVNPDVWNRRRCNDRFARTP